MSVKSRHSIQWDLWAGALPWLALVLMTVPYFTGQITRGSWWITLVVWLGVMFHAWRQLACDAVTLVGRKRMAIGLLVISAIVASAGVWTQTYVWIYLALVTQFVAWALGRWSAAGWQHILALGALLLCAGIEFASEWNSFLGHMAVARASDILSFLQVEHLPTSLGLQTLDREMYLSGTMGLLSLRLLLVVSIALALTFRRSLVHAVFLMASCPIWMVLAITLGICIAYWQERSISPDPWSTNSMLMGQFALVTLALALIAMADQMLARIMQAVPVTQLEYSAVFDLYNLALSWPQMLPESNLPAEDADDVDEDFPSPAPVVETDQETDDRTSFDWWNSLVARLIVIVVSLAFLGLAGLQTLVMAKHGVGVARETSATDLSELSQQPLPDSLGMWRPVEEATDAKRRSTQINLARSNANQWSSDWNGLEVQAFVESHLGELPRVFEPEGESWQLWGSRIFKSSDNPKWKFRQSVYKGFRGSSVLVFNALIYSNGSPVDDSKLLDSAPPHASLVELLQGSEATSAQTKFVVTIQCETGRELSDAELRSFIAHAEAFRNGIRDMLGSGVPAAGVDVPSTKEQQ